MDKMSCRDFSYMLFYGNQKSTRCQPTNRNMLSQLSETLKLMKASKFKKASIIFFLNGRGLAM